MFLILRDSSVKSIVIVFCLNYERISVSGKLFILILKVFVSLIVMMIVEYVLLYWLIFKSFGNLLIELKFFLLNLYFLYVSVKISVFFGVFLVNFV